MRAHVFSHLNQLPLMVTNYHQIKIGPWLRNDRSKRNYNGFFVFEKNRLGEKMDRLKLRKFENGLQQTEPPVKKITNGIAGSSWLFSEMPHYTKYFEELNENRGLVIQLLNDIISPLIKEKLNDLRAPVIGVHIRRGDFREPAEGEELGKRGILRTPESYFVDMIKSIRSVHGSDLRADIFSDASKNELKEVFKLPNVYMVEGNNDLVDLLLLSRSKIIVTSAGSTFSYWAAFISDVPVIMHPTYVGIKIRPENVRDTLYEGAFDGNNEILKRRIHLI